MADPSRIERKADVMAGKPVIRGTRITVEVILRQAASGMTAERIMEEYGLEREDVLAAFEYSANVMGEHGVIATE